MESNASSLTSRLMVITLSIVIGLCTVFLVSNYVLTQQALDRELKRTHEYRANLTKLALDEQLKTISETLKAISHQFESEDTVQRSKIINYLEEFTLSQEGRYTDILVVTAKDGNILNNLSSPFVRQVESFIDYYQKNYSPNGWHLALLKGETNTPAALMSAISLIEPEFGKVLGQLIYGVSLNDNTPLVNDLKRSAELDGLELRANYELLPITSTHNRPIEMSAHETSILISSEGDHLVMYTYIANQLKQDIDEAYLKNAAFVFVLGCLAVVLMIALIHRIVSKSVDSLTEYASSIEKSLAYRPFKEGGISDFNSLGKTLASLVKSLQDSRFILEKKEEHIRQIINSTAEAIYGLDEQGVCTFVNKACVEKLRYQLETDLVGKKMHGLMHYKHADGSDYPESECPVFQSLKSGEHVHCDDEVVWRADGTSFPAEYWSHPILEQGEIAGAVVTFFDISEKKKTEASLRRAQKMEAVGQLTGGIAHDFNNIMGIILGNISLIKRKSESDAKLDSIENAAIRATDLTKQLLGFSREKTTEVKVTNINRVITDMKHLITRSLTPEIELEFFLANSKLLALTNSGELSDAILNLVINAKDAMPHGGKLTIETTECYLDELYCAQNPECHTGPYIQIVVSDTGDGVPVEEQERIFDPFFTTKPQGKGTGLGLAMVFGFAKRSSGSIKLYSERDLGATFRLYLPQTDDHEEEQIQEIKQELPLGKELILIVDDEPDLVRVTQQQLESLGYQILTAKDGVDALEQLRLHPDLDLLFSDVVMPGGLNGFQLAEKALAYKPTLKVLLTSGYTGKAVRNKEQALFVTKLLPKPYTLRDLAFTVREQLDNEACLASAEDKKNMPEPKIGMEIFDDEHRQIKLFMERSKALETAPNDEQMALLIKDIEKYIETHIPLEEAILKACAYPGYQNHCQVHRLLEKQFQKVKAHYESSEVSAELFSEFLGDWWLDHILTMDAKAIKHCKEFDDKVRETIFEYRQQRPSS